LGLYCAIKLQCTVKKNLRYNRALLTPTGMCQPKIIELVH